MKYIPISNRPNVSETRLTSISPSLRIDDRGYPHISWLEQQEGSNEVHYSYWDGLKWSYKGIPEVYLSESEITSSPDSLVLDGNNKPVIVFSRKSANGSVLTLADYGSKWDFNELEVTYDASWIGLIRYDRDIAYSSSSSSSSSSVDSSSSSSSSSSEQYSSSSSSHQFYYRELRDTIINQNNYNLIPFSLIAEQGTDANLDDSKIGFTIEASNSDYLDYEAVIDRDNGYFNEEPNIDSPTVYIPEDARSKYKHESSFYVDIIAKNQSGIRDVRTHVEPNKYEFEKIEDTDNVFNIPKFTWGNTASSITTTTTTRSFLNSFWVGAGTHRMFNIEYDEDSAAITYDTDLGSQVNRILFGINNNKMYVSTSNDLFTYSVDYYTENNDIAQLLSVENPDKLIMDAYKDENDSVWSVDSYGGKVLKIDPVTLEATKEYDGLDSPTKVIYSTYHDAYFVSSSYILFKIDDNTSTVSIVYQINDYILRDFAVSEDGKICMLWDGPSKDIMRVIDKDLYTFLLNEEITDSNLRFCKYCNAGRFYALSEIDTTTSVYASVHYVFDSVSNILEKTVSEKDLLVTTTTTTLGITTKAVQVETPNGGEEVELGEEYEIKWISSKALTDLVKIELYKGNEFYSTIISSTENTGIYKWSVPSNLDEDEDYKVRITWISASTDPNNYDDSDSNFTITETATPTTTTSTTTVPTEFAVAIDYDADNDYMVVMLASGLFGLFELPTSEFVGLIETNITDPICIAVNGFVIGGLDKQTKVRIFVGSQPYWSDKWDSGIVETELTSAYYGGGNNLEHGKRYYVNIQTYSERYGWGELQVREFVMPK